MKIPFINAHIVTSTMLEDLQDVIEAYETILSGVVPELEQVALALHELKCGGSAATRRKRRRAIYRKIMKFNKVCTTAIGGEECS